MDLKRYHMYLNRSLIDLRRYHIDINRPLMTMTRSHMDLKMPLMDLERSRGELPYIGWWGCAEGPRETMPKSLTEADTKSYP